jgi:hypothetical protein
MDDAQRLVKCSQCGELHDLRNMEVAYALPDAYFELTEEEREARGSATPDFCQLDERYFVRSVAPVPVIGEERPYCWGIWVEVSHSDFLTIHRTWNDADVSEMPRMGASVANALPEYESALGLGGEIELRADSRPFFFVLDESRFKDDQRSGVRAEDVTRYHHHVA